MAEKRTFKSKRKLSGVRCVYRAWGEWATGDYIIGKFVGSKTDQYDKPNWMFEVVDAGFSKKKESADLIGKTIGLNSSGKIDRAMKKVEIGTMVQVMYNGTSVIEKGKYKGKDAHDIEVDEVEEEGAESDEEIEDEDIDEGDDL